MSVSTDPALLVLHTLRLKSFVDADVVANASRLADQVAEATLEQLSAHGFVSYRNGRISGWSLTTAGRIEGERRLSEELDALGCRALATDAYQRFLGLNRRFLGACTRWQLRAEDGTHFVNDHTDEAYDASVIAELDAVDDAVQPVCHQLASALPRFAYYNGRFAAARVRVHAGEHDWFTKPVIDSYHTIWFELHENLLATLNLERADESQ